ncbi:hypothetical protein [Rhodocaloribacter sp.]
MFRRLFLIASLTLLFGARTALAQMPPEPEALVYAWIDEQAEHARNLTGVTFLERSLRTSDSPVGTRTMRVEAEVTGMPGTDTWERRILSVTLNGRPAPEKRLRNMEFSWHAPNQPEFTRLTQAVMLPRRLLRRLDFVNEAVDDSLGGTPCWRFDALPPTDASPIDRITFWFAQDDGRLVRTRIILSQDEKKRGQTLHTHIESAYDFERIEGFDVPRRRRFEGTRQYLRRGRVFTDVVSLDATYSDFRFSFQ